MQKLRGNRCIVETETLKDEERILENKQKLRKSKRNVYINNNLTQNKQNIYLSIRKRMKGEKKCL